MMNDEWKEMTLIGYYGIRNRILKIGWKKKMDCVAKMVDQSFETSKDIFNIFFFKIENKFTIEEKIYFC